MFLIDCTECLFFPEKLQSDIEQCLYASYVYKKNLRKNPHSAQPRLRHRLRLRLHAEPRSLLIGGNVGFDQRAAKEHCFVVFYSLDFS